MNAAIDMKEHLLQTIRDYLAQAENPHITLEAFCGLAGVSEVAFRHFFPDIRQIHLELLIELGYCDFLSRKQANQAEAGLIRRFDDMVDRYWPNFGKDNYGRYERNLMQYGLQEFFQQAEESAAIAREHRNSYVQMWLEDATCSEGFQSGISSAALADFRASLQFSMMINPTFDALCSYRKTMDETHQLWMRYLRRHMPKQVAA
jgi:hypothetical protein